MVFNYLVNISFILCHCHFILLFNEELTIMSILLVINGVIVGDPNIYTYRINEL